MIRSKKISYKFNLSWKRYKNEDFDIYLFFTFSQTALFNSLNFGKFIYCYNLHTFFFRNSKVSFIFVQKFKRLFWVVLNFWLNYPRNLTFFFSMTINFTKKPSERKKLEITKELFRHFGNFAASKGRQKYRTTNFLPLIKHLQINRWISVYERH